ncbi:Heat-labile enterotoxin IIB, A chain [Tolypocladium paradoxum]|uniref:Heat-labile enterotoxin IIB, A chain n=1 Tax=Tolypocladium paradoxum TaxID=94208 RepID=A0A2S4KYR6_9HYPO|nr:Heat-labile enterotoxin IIB, A chain [Tolypocladium paradoxum]
MLWNNILSAAPLWLLWLGSGNASPVSPSDVQGTIARRAPHRPAKFVYRGDKRSPRDLREAGGFRPRGEYEDNDRTFTIYRHMLGEWGRGEDSEDSDTDLDEPWSSAFVSVTTELETGASYGHWLYRIHATPNMIDPTVENEGEPEIFALGGVRWSQVVGYRHANIDQQETITDASFTPNPDYLGERYDRSTLTLVGPRSGWRRHGRRHWTQFMNRAAVGSDVGFTGQFPLQFETYTTNDNIPGPSPETQQERPPSSPPAGAQVPELNWEDIVVVAEYLQEHNAPCDLGALDPSTRYLTLGADATFARALARPDQERPNHTGTIDEADPGIRAGIDRLREGEERSTCHLVTTCGSMYQLPQRKRAAGKVPEQAPNRTHMPLRVLNLAPSGRAALEDICRKIYSPKKTKTDACDSVRDLEFGFELTEEFGAGTYDRLAAILKGPSGKTEFEIADAPKAGFHPEWFPVDANAFGSKTLDLKKGITKVELTAAGHYSGPKNDQWMLQGFKLRGWCVESGYRVVVDKFASLNTWYQHKPTGIISDQLKPQTVATFEIARADWHMRPPCSYIEELKFDFNLANDFGAGTYDTLRLSLGTEKTILLRDEPSAGLHVSNTVSLKEIFRTDEVAVRDVKRMAIIDLPSESFFGKDKWEFQGMLFLANLPPRSRNPNPKPRCAASTKWMEMKKFSAVNRWLQHGGGNGREEIWSGDILPEDWREV